uniref:LOW QUALITY PROTEIN: uncharacterized protein LOC120334414 n=1 Tax=Styela clava TaxID=7725 RepID=UPI001939987D|nr:LOW QUALITY PROTEIN: uncharacterized protein LOC120334414 [Styela clava]
MSVSPIVTSPESDQDSHALLHHFEYQNQSSINIHEVTRKRRCFRSARSRTFSTDTNSAETCPKSQFSWSSISKLDKSECPKDVRSNTIYLKSEIEDFENDEPEASGESDAETRDSQTNGKKKKESYFIWRLFAHEPNQDTENDEKVKSDELQADEIENDLTPLTDKPINESPKVQTDNDTNIEEINVSNPYSLNSLQAEKGVKTPPHSSENSPTVNGFLYFAILLTFCLPYMQNGITQPKKSTKESKRKKKDSSEKNERERNTAPLSRNSKPRINWKEYIDHEKEVNNIQVKNEVSDQIRTQISVHTECWVNRQKRAESGISGCNNDATAASSFNHETSTEFQSRFYQMGHLVNSCTIFNDNIVLNNLIKSEEFIYEKGKAYYNKDIKKEKDTIPSNFNLKNKDDTDSTTDRWSWKPIESVSRHSHVTSNSIFLEKKIVDKIAFQAQCLGIGETISNAENKNPGTAEEEFGSESECQNEYGNESTHQTKIIENSKLPSLCCEASETTSDDKDPEKESGVAKGSETKEIEPEPFQQNKAFEDELEHWCDLLICRKEKPYQKSEAFLEDEFQFYKKKENYESQNIFEWSFKHEELSECLNTIPPVDTATFNSEDYLSRFQTFQGLRINSWYSWEDFARAGFYVIFDNTLACYSCSLQVRIEDVVSRPPANPRWHHPGCGNLQNSSYHSPSSSCGRRSYVSLQNCFGDIESDGAVSDDIRDPPGQQSIYIPPGDSRLEQYRLSTYEHYPISSPTTRKSLAKAGFYFTGFFDRVKCFCCARTVELWNDIDSPSDIRWHKNDCLFIRGHDSGNIPMKSLFNRSNAQASSSRQQEEVLQQIDQNTGNVLRTVHYPADLPERVRQTGGTFEIGSNNTIRIQTGPGLQNTGNGGNSSQPRRWRMENVISSDHRRFLTNLHLNRELDRLASFARWPVGRPSVPPAALARTGFFYLGDMDRTQCFSCGGVLSNWTLEDDAMAEHRSHFPNCKIVLGTEQRNYKVNEFPDPPADRARDYPCRFPSNPHMSNEVARQDTFDHRLPVGRTAATPAEISQAGFFFLGERDRVKCWYCNGGLQNWEYDDMPWIEHAKWFPTCQFLLQVKGQHFVYRHLSLSPHLNRPIIARQDGSPLEGAIQPGESHDIPANEEKRKMEEAVEKYMKESDDVNNILSMGFSERIVRIVIGEKLREGKLQNIPIEELLDAVIEKKKELEPQPMEVDGEPSQEGEVIFSFCFQFKKNLCKFTCSFIIMFIIL